MGASVLLTILDLDVLPDMCFATKPYHIYIYIYLSDFSSLATFMGPKR